MWDFETEPGFQRSLDWAAEFVRTEVQPLEFVISNPYDVTAPLFRELVRPLQDRVRAAGLWACHLGPELGGPGYGQLKLALLNEVLGRSSLAPVVFGCAAPDTGNAEILAHYGTPELKKRFLEPLLAGEVVSCFSMTEPQGGSDPTLFTTTAVAEGDHYVINGEKWFSSNATWAAFLIVMAVTDPDAPPHRRLSMFVVPADTPGIHNVRDVGITGFGTGHFASHAYLRYENVRVPAANMLGGRGDAFVVAQTRLGGGRIHHAMRTVGSVARAFEMMCERAVSRESRGGRLADKQLVQEMIADSWIELEQFRLLVLRTAWRIDRYNDYKRVRADISAVKAAMPKVLNNVASRALQVHGSLGLSDEMPFVKMVLNSFHLGLADGPTEIHKTTLARQLLRDVPPSPDLFPSGHLPRLRDQALERYADALARHTDGVG